jgi:hypothetical protein
VILSTWLSVLLFLLFVAPGFLFDLLSERRRASYEESAFGEVSRVVLASLSFSLAGVIGLAVIRALRPALMPDPGKLLAQHRDMYIAHHSALLLRALAAQVLLAFGAAALTNWLLGKRHGSGTIRKMSAWQTVLRHKLPKGHDAYVRVRLSGGIVYTGLVYAHSPDLDLDNRELILRQPMSSKLPGGELSPVPGQFKVVAIRGSLIETMSVEYRPVAARRQGSPHVPAAAAARTSRQAVISRLRWADPRQWRRGSATIKTRKDHAARTG